LFRRISDGHFYLVLKNLVFYPMTKTFKGKPLFRFLNFGYWDLFDIWDLALGNSTDNHQT